MSIIVPRRVSTNWDICKSLSLISTASSSITALYSPSFIADATERHISIKENAVRKTHCNFGRRHSSSLVMLASGRDDSYGGSQLVGEHSLAGDREKITSLNWIEGRHL